jgi:homoprotocatechuate degradation regulator HpaR
VSSAAKPPAIAHRTLPLLLLRAREDVIARFRPILHAHGVTEQQWRILRALAESEPRALEPRQICDLCTLSSPSLTGVLSRMDHLRLVARRRVDADQRRLLVSLTPKSRAIVRRMAPLVEREYLALEAAVGQDLVQDAYALLDRMSARLRAAAARDGAEPPSRPPAPRGRRA